jgi:hypothetical protein
MKTKLLLLIVLIFSAININAQINSVAIVGEAVGGWPPFVGDDPNQLTQIDATNWKIENLTIAAGKCKLRANNAWGGAGFEWAGAFPTAVGTKDGDINVPVAGVYTVTLDTSSGVYNFESGTPLPTVKLVGSTIITGGILMSPSAQDTYSISNTTLSAGTVQFEIDGQLSGGTTFPTGDATSSTDFIPVPAAFFSSITINIATGAYSFVEIPPVSIVGDGVGGWPPFPGNDPNQLSSSDGINYSLDKLACIVGTAKFRQDNAWTINWGEGTFPIGTAVQNSEGNIDITTAGTYDVRFNRVTREFSFAIPSIALVGAAAGGWPPFIGNDPNQMTTTDGVTYTLANVALTADICKFRANNAWDVNWGDPAFPSGMGTQGGDNIAVTTAGNYDVTLNRVTGAYNFTTALSLNQFGIDAVSVYPNPTKGMFSINGDVAKVQIFNLTGQLVKTFNNATANESLTISELNQGIYFAKVTDSNLNEKTIKLIKE